MPMEGILFLFHDRWSTDAGVRTSTSGPDFLKRQSVFHHWRSNVCVLSGLYNSRLVSPESSVPRKASWRVWERASALVWQPNGLGIWRCRMGVCWSRGRVSDSRAVVCIRACGFEAVFEFLPCTQMTFYTRCGGILLISTFIVGKDPADSVFIYVEHWWAVWCVRLCTPVVV